jgi:hypothetical protein
MKLTITPTSEIVIVEGGFSARVWNAVTEKGTPCQLLVAGLRVREDLDQTEFEGILIETEGIPNHHFQPFLKPQDN